MLKHFMEDGLPKGQAILTALVVTIFGFFIIRWMPFADEWLKPNMFMLVWIVFFIMLHNPTLDKPEDLYEYSNGVKQFDYVVEIPKWLDAMGEDGWSLVFMYPDPEAPFTFTYMFKRKYYSKPKVTKIRDDRKG